MKDLRAHPADSLVRAIADGGTHSGLVETTAPPQALRVAIENIIFDRAPSRTTEIT